MTDQPTTEVQLAAARATNRRLNLRAQQLESELATYRRAVDQWEISERGTYVPLRTITAIAKTAGRNIENPRWLLHYQRVEQAEAAIVRVRNLAGRIRQGVPWTANDRDIAAHILRAVDGDQTAPVWTPPPPGDRCEQLPDHLLDLIRDRLPDYLSTACQTADALACTATYRHPRYDEIRAHAERLHQRCRTNQKFTGQLCACGCHGPAEPLVHIGGRVNAEDCPACAGTNLPYPFICPGGDEAAAEFKPEAATLNSTAANASRVEPDGLREQLHAAIESEVYEYRERSMWWPETGGVTQEIARLATRGALEALGMPEVARRRTDVGTEFIRQITEGEDDGLDGAWTPDPPIGCLTLAGPESPPPPSDPRDQYEAAIHQAFLTTPTRIPGGQPRPGTPDSHVHGLGHMYDMTCALCRGDAKALTAAVLGVLGQERPEPGVHIYLSTGCWHGDHAYCQAMTGLNGAKRPGECKKCAAKCVCGCHTAEAPPVPRDPCPYCETSPVRIPRTGMGQHIADVPPEVSAAGRGKERP